MNGFLKMDVNVRETTIHVCITFEIMLKYMTVQVMVVSQFI